MTVPNSTPVSVALTAVAHKARTNLVRLRTEQRDTAAETHEVAKKSLSEARWRLGRAENKHSMLLRIDRDLPASGPRTKGINDSAAFMRRMKSAKRFAKAMVAASAVALHAAELALLEATVAAAAAAAPLPTGERAELATTPVCRTALTASRFTAVTRRWDWRATGGWITAEPETWTREYATNIVLHWVKALGAWVLADATGALFIATADRVIELAPIREAAPTEGDVLEAALNAYGLISHADGMGGKTCRVMPVDHRAPDEETYRRPHLLIYAGERADRPVREYAEPWSVHLHDENGEYVDQVYVAAKGLECVEASAACAKAIATWTERRNALTIGRMLRDRLASLGIATFDNDEAGNTWLIVPRNPDDPHNGPHLIVFGWNEDEECSVDLPLGQQTGLTISVHDGLHELHEPLYRAEDPNLTPCLRAIVRWALLGPLDDKVREAARCVQEWEQHRTDVLAGMGLGPGERPDDSSELDYAIRDFEKSALALLCDFRDLLNTLS